MGSRLEVLLGIEVLMVGGKDLSLFVCGNLFVNFFNRILLSLEILVVIFLLRRIFYVSQLPNFNILQF